MRLQVRIIFSYILVTFYFLCSMAPIVEKLVDQSSDSDDSLDDDSASSYGCER